MLCASTILFVACTTDEDFNNDTVYDKETASTNIRSYEEALEIANNATKLLNGNVVTRTGFPRKVDESKGVKYVTNRITRSGTPDTLLYIFNYEGEEGYAIVSAKKTTEGLLAVTESGYYDPNIGTDNPGLEMFINGAVEYVGAAAEPAAIVGPLPLTKYKSVIDTVSYINVPARVPVRWGQNGIYGKYCPNSKSGCSNTAAGMAMSYFGHPSTLYINYDTTNPFTLTLNWDNIRNHIYGSYYPICCSEETHNSIGHLLRQLGHLSNSNYLANQGTSTTTTNTHATLASLGYTLSPIGNTINKMDALEDGKLILMRGDDPSEGGHMWLVDGCYHCIISEQGYFCSDGILWEPAGDPFITVQSYYHFNWGWDGCNNGMFNANIYRPSGYSSLDNGCSSSLDMNYNFGTSVKYFTIDL